MTKNSLYAIAHMDTHGDAALETAKAEALREVEKNEAKASANRELYSVAHDVVIAHMGSTPMTVAEIVEACGDELPEGFSKSKVQYALLHYWENEVVKVEQVKGANQYRLA